MFKRTKTGRKYPKRKKDFTNPAELKRELIAQMRRVFWYYYRPVHLKFYRDRDEQGFYWACNSCVAIIRQEANAKVDHREPVKDTEVVEQSWDIYVERLFTLDPKKTQILCKPCHSGKSAAENARRIK